MSMTYPRKEGGFSSPAFFFFFDLIYLHFFWFVEFSTVLPPFPLPTLLPRLM